VVLTFALCCVYRYVNANIETSRRAAAALDAFNSEAAEQLVAAEEVESDLILDRKENRVSSGRGFAAGPERARPDSKSGSRKKNQASLPFAASR